MGWFGWSPCVLTPHTVRGRYNRLKRKKDKATHASKEKNVRRSSSSNNCPRGKVGLGLASLVQKKRRQP